MGLCIMGKSKSVESETRGNKDGILFSGRKSFEEIPLI